MRSKFANRSRSGAIGGRLPARGEAARARFALGQPAVATDVAVLAADDDVDRVAVADVADAPHGRSVDAREPARLEHVARPVAELDRLPEGLARLSPRPLLVELVGDVSDDEPVCARALTVIAGLGRRQMAADAGALGPRQRRLEHQQVGVAGELDQLLVRSAVGA